MKAVLVIDMPRECNDGCPLYNEEYDSCGYYKTPARYENCPLKPMPSKLDANDWHRMFGGTYKEREAKGHGWNACLEEIEGSD